MSHSAAHVLSFAPDQDDAANDRRGTLTPLPPGEYGSPPREITMRDLMRLIARVATEAPSALPTILSLILTCRETTAALRAHHPRVEDIIRLSRMGTTGKALTRFWTHRDLAGRARAAAKAGLMPGGMADEAGA